MGEWEIRIRPLSFLVSWLPYRHLPYNSRMYMFLNQSGLL